MLHELALVGALSAPATQAASEVLAARSVEVTSLPVVLDPARPESRTIGHLEYRGGVQLKSGDERFGGWSALWISPDGSQLVAVADEGQWLRARLTYDGHGTLTGVGEARMGALVDLLGRPLAGKRWQDAESLARLADGSWIVGFEREHRIWRYPAGDAPFEGAPLPVKPPKGLERAPENGGLESLAALPDGRLVALTEEAETGGRLRGWVRKGKSWTSISYPVEGLLRPSDACADPAGNLLVLERGYSPDAGVTIRLLRVARNAVHGAILGVELLGQIQPPLTVDNFEGIATRRGSDGETLVYLISDDNFSPPQQRTLLMMFAIDAPATGAERGRTDAGSPHTE